MPRKKNPSPRAGASENVAVTESGFLFTSRRHAGSHAAPPARRSGGCQARRETRHIRREPGWPRRRNTAAWHRGAGTHPVLEVGEVGVPAQRDHVDINHPVLGWDEEEIHELSRRPDAPVSLPESKEQSGAPHRSPVLTRGGRGSSGREECIYLVKLPKLLLQLLPALL